MIRVISVALLMVAVLVGCNKDTKVGEGLEGSLQEQKQAEAIGRVIVSPEPTATSAVLGESPEPEPSPSPTKRVVFSLILTKESPFYDPGQEVTVQVGTVLKITNNDDKVRRYATQGGPYDTGSLQPGGTIEIVLDIAGKWQIYDESVPFATATLEVR